MVTLSLYAKTSFDQNTDIQNIGSVPQFKLIKI